MKDYATNASGTPLCYGIAVPSVDYDKNLINLAPIHLEFGNNLSMF